MIIDHLKHSLITLYFQFSKRSLGSYKLFLRKCTIFDVIEYLKLRGQVYMCHDVILCAELALLSYQQLIFAVITLTVIT